MEITKKQIKFIDDHLKKMGIKYWDLRIEMIDHIVSDMEKNNSFKDFKTEFSLSLKRVKWNGYLSGINKEGWQNVNRKYRKIYFEGFINFFKELKNVIVFLILFSCYFLLSENLENELFFDVSFAIFTLPGVACFYLFYKSWKQKLGKSVHMDYGVSYLTFSILMLNVILVSFKPEEGASSEYYKILLLIIVPIHYVFMYSGYKVYKLAIKRVQEMKNHLLSL